MDVLEGAGGAQEVVDGRVEPLLAVAVLPRADLRVESGDVEEHRGLLKGHCPLAAGHAGQGVVPEQEKNKSCP